jgi:hypothetical protein
LAVSAATKRAPLRAHQLTSAKSRSDCEESAVGLARLAASCRSTVAAIFQQECGACGVILTPWRKTGEDAAPPLTLPLLPPFPWAGFVVPPVLRSLLLPVLALLLLLLLLFVLLLPLGLLLAPCAGGWATFVCWFGFSARGCEFARAGTAALGRSVEAVRDAGPVVVGGSAGSEGARLELRVRVGAGGACCCSRHA